MMTYDEFKEYTADHLAEYIAADRSADAQVDINCVYKNNGIVISLWHDGGRTG